MVEANRFIGEEGRWSALTQRDPTADGAFVYAVRTTGVYCRPTCPARFPKRENVIFFATGAEAERSGFRPCKRCRPNEQPLEVRQRDLIIEACRQLESSNGALQLDDLARSAGMSRFHFHRVFKQITGVTPKAYALAKGRRLPTKKSKTTNVRYAVATCSLGVVLVAVSQKGVREILLGESPEMLVEDLRTRYPQAEFRDNTSDLADLVRQVVALVDNPLRKHELPLDLCGTAFQISVWKALGKIEPGVTLTYAELATKMGRATAARAVGRACATNTLAVAVPCHRIVGATGALTGYRWGLERKAELLRKECGASDNGTKNANDQSICRPQDL